MKATFPEYRESPEARNRYNAAAVLASEQYRRAIGNDSDPVGSKYSCGALIELEQSAEALLTSDGRACRDDGETGKGRAADCLCLGAGRSK